MKKMTFAMACCFFAVSAVAQEKKTQPSPKQTIKQLAPPLNKQPSRASLDRV
jgi:hypothetical protein